jgi:hypothetical protein
VVCEAENGDLRQWILGGSPLICYASKRRARHQSGKRAGAGEHMVKDLTDSFGECLTEIFESCIAQGMALPFIVCVVTANGSLWAFRFHGPETNPEQLAVPPDDLAAFPINIMIVDRTGEGERVLLTAEGRRRFTTRAR